MIIIGNDDDIVEKNLENAAFSHLSHRVHHLKYILLIYKSKAEGYRICNISVHCAVFSGLSLGDWKYNLQDIEIQATFPP